jgi:AcrR family transcriptional regulator
MKRSRAPYHHGNLRATLIEAGLKLIEEKGVRALTLREIGSRVGVSRMAAYRHFSDKADLLAAIREAGFVQFVEALEIAWRGALPNFSSRLTALAVAYVRFAAAHRAHFEVMFGEPSDENAPPGGGPGARAFGILVETIQSGQESGEVREGDPVTFARIAWAQVHGISMLGLEPDLSPSGAGTRFVEFSSGVLKAGMAAKPGEEASGKLSEAGLQWVR